MPSKKKNIVIAIAITAWTFTSFVIFLMVVTGKIGHSEIWRIAASSIALLIFIGLSLIFGYKSFYRGNSQL